MSIQGGKTKSKRCLNDRLYTYNRNIFIIPNKQTNNKIFKHEKNTLKKDTIDKKLEKKTKPIYKTHQYD